MSWYSGNELCDGTYKARKINDSLAFFRGHVTPGGELK